MSSLEKCLLLQLPQLLLLVPPSTGYPGQEPKGMDVVARRKLNTSRAGQRPHVVETQTPSPFRLCLLAKTRAQIQGLLSPRACFSA